jgi:aquaporin Z
VNYVATVPGPGGPAIAFMAELLISFGLMLTVLTVSNTGRTARFTPFFAGALVATYIMVEAPLSGMSMNPARTLGSAVPAGTWTWLAIYFTAPPLGMLLAAEVYPRLKGTGAVICAKLHHQNRERCIFRCGYAVDQLAVGTQLDQPHAVSSRGGERSTRRPGRRSGSVAAFGMTHHMSNVETEA